MTSGTLYPYIRELQDVGQVKGTPVANSDRSSRIKTTQEFSLTATGAVMVKRVRTSLLALFAGKATGKPEKKAKKATRSRVTGKKVKSKANGKANGKAHKKAKKPGVPRVKSIPAPAADPNSGAVA